MPIDDLDDVNTYNNEEDKRRWSDFVAPWKFDDRHDHIVRLFGPIWVEYRHAVTTKNDNTYAVNCLAWDEAANTFLPNKTEVCPYCAAAEKSPKRIKGSYRYFTNLIDIEEEQKKPIDSTNWSPIRMIELAPSLFTKIKELKLGNKKVSVTDPNNGANLYIKINKKASPVNMYTAIICDTNVALTKQQLSYKVVQRYPDGTSTVKEGNGKLPGHYEYIRMVSSKEEAERSLRNNGYLEALPKDSTPVRKPDLQDVGLSEMEDFDIPFDGDEPAPPSNPTKVAKGSEVSEVSRLNPKQPAFCPTSFGNFADASECFNDCDSLRECRNLSINSKPTANTRTIDLGELDDL